MAVYGSLFVSAFLAATVLPVSSEVVLVGLLATGRGDPALLFTVATIGNTLGSVVNWILG
ncbi:MAG: DedA family protein, partial [Mesorhizobium sp.]